ncbi:MAG: UDP-N-acetylglucosamine 2-epimerase (non-hydrolyzing) [Conexivisphaerales archaeon]
MQLICDGGGYAINICLILGTRPEIIKLSPLIRMLESKRFSYFIVHTGQHYSSFMNDVFFTGLNIPPPRYNLHVGSGSHAEETGKMLIGIEQVLKKEYPDVVLVQGDTNTTLAGALAASKLHILLGHVEAGLRSFDRRMPEELNRIVADHTSDMLFAPTRVSYSNLKNEGIESKRIFVTGNTIADAIHLYKDKISAAKVDGITAGESYFLCTLHREENVDNPSSLRKIAKGLGLVHDKTGKRIILPLHPRTEKRLTDYNLSLPKGIEVIKPLDYLTFVRLESQADLILTDSGGVQEEACILRVPCVTLRQNTERPETIRVGANVLAGTEPDSILEKAIVMLKRDRNWPNPFGNGRASAKILKIINEKMKEQQHSNELL